MEEEGGMRGWRKDKEKGGGRREVGELLLSYK